MSEVAKKDFRGATKLDANTGKAMVDALKSGISWNPNEGVAWALVLGERGNFALLCGEERTIVEDSLDLGPPHHKYGDASRDPQVVPRQDAGNDDNKSEVLVLTYLGGEYVGFCTYINGTPRWF